MNNPIPEKTVKELHKAARTRARERGIPFDLTYEYVLQLSIESNGKCALSGLPFDLSERKKFFRRPYAASLDRIEAAKGYVKGNCRLVCMCVNFAMSNWGQTILFEMARAVCRKNDLADWMHGGTGDRIGLMGVNRRKRKDGLWTYHSRISYAGSDYTVGRFATEYEAHKRYVEVREALDRGAAITDFITATSRLMRHTKQQRIHCKPPENLASTL